MPKIAELLGPEQFALFEDLMGGPILDVNLTVTQSMPTGASSFHPSCYWPWAEGGEWVQIAVSLPGEIYITDEAWQEGTAATIALIGHEYVHQRQYNAVPKFLERYAEAEETVRAMDWPPYKNVYEWPAYLKEALLYRQLVAAGLPPGDRVPVLIMEGLVPMLRAPMLRAA